MPMHSWRTRTRTLTVGAPVNSSWHQESPRHHISFHLSRLALVPWLLQMRWQAVLSPVVQSLLQQPRQRQCRSLGTAQGVKLMPRGAGCQHGPHPVPPAQGAGQGPTLWRCGSLAATLA